jgi:hypothetical protein
VLLNTDPPLPGHPTVHRHLLRPRRTTGDLLPLSLSLSLSLSAGSTRFTRDFTFSSRSEPNFVL